MTLYNLHFKIDTFMFHPISLKNELAAYQRNLNVWYTYPEQLIFIGETSVVQEQNSALKNPLHKTFILAALDTSGFISWTSSKDAFNRSEFHKGFCKYILPLLNPWPFPRSIVVIDGKETHMYSELIEAVEKQGAMIMFLPHSYVSDLNPIEYQFLRLKRYIEEKCNLIWTLSPPKVLEVAMRDLPSAWNLFHYCGYKDKQLCFGR